MSDEWIEWGGGNNPVKPGQRVRIKYWQGAEEEIDYILAWQFDWFHGNGLHDIIAYKIISEKSTVKIDLVNHPPHYKKHPSGIECIEITRHMTLNLGSAVKYIWRAGEKDDLITDLKKAVWHLNDEITRLSAISAGRQPQSKDPAPIASKSNEQA